MTICHPQMKNSTKTSQVNTFLLRVFLVVHADYGRCFHLNGSGLTLFAIFFVRVLPLQIFMFNGSPYVILILKTFSRIVSV